MATLTKIYPILLLVVVVRRRDWALVATCFATIILAYVPYIILGHGQVFGFFSTYASERTPNEGVVPLFAAWLAPHLGLSRVADLVTGYALDILLLGAVALFVLWRRLVRRMSVEVAVLLLFGAVFAVSSHIFPWYTTALLPWVALVIEPVWTREGLSGKGLAVALAWYLPVVSILGYTLAASPDWSMYYLVAYDVVLVGLVLAAIVELRRIHRGKSYDGL
jgi:hypothetical protein